MRDIIRLDGYHMDDEIFQKSIGISSGKYQPPKNL